VCSENQKAADFFSNAAFEKKSIELFCPPLFFKVAYFSEPK
jgi:hypothetical protein